MPRAFIIILCMALVTMIPRMIPAFIVERVRFPEWVNHWLHVIPYAALGALIFPGVLSVVPEKPWIGLVGGIVAIILSIFRIHIVAVVLGASLAVFFLI
ncbi:branched-subunit amino acid transport protein [Natronobacillus azotifigens]|uniref:AzlD domain-containing protein n=1 Tax=Natronobacillus azotifigens TaxID=472978 RepID=A0A9J6R9S9_9BACI|nr:AzlD domain-containing protein [Natronobacillus azotifigens]MCZ0702059.1 AzlD domain-containing protein [Natronobacillus azotifigens]